jgi:hypothetical protein
MFDSADGDADESEATNEEDEADDATEPDDPNDPDYELLQDGDLGDITDEFISNELSVLDEEDDVQQQQQGAKQRGK